MSSLPKHERIEDLTENTKDLERARQSLMEELEATSLYQERIDVSRNESLKKILVHNMNEEKEHIAMLIDWLRKNDPTQDKAFEHKEE